MSSEFREIARSDHLPARIAAEIGREIAEGRFGAGDRLPTEHLLAKSFGVSRSVVREAIAQLRNEGLVETRQGVGAFVTDPHRRAAIRVAQESLNDPASFRHFFQLRLPLEIEAAGLAAAHRSAEDMEALNEALAGMIHARDWADDGVKADLAFHRALAGATRNPYFPIFLGFVAERFSTTITTAFSIARPGEIVQVTIDEHAAIHDAVAARDTARAREAMRAHLLGAAHRLRIDLDLF